MHYFSQPRSLRVAGHLCALQRCYVEVDSVEIALHESITALHMSCCAPCKGQTKGGTPAMLRMASSRGALGLQPSLSALHVLQPSASRPAGSVTRAW